MGERELALSELKKSATGTESPGATHRSLRDTDEGRDKSASITASIEQINGRNNSRKQWQNIPARSFTEVRDVG